jgi:L-glutamine-phosphate cytidylyltransferase
MRAIIYAAGISSRMNDFIPDGLKGLSPVGDQYLIKYQLDWLVNYKPTDIIIVLGLEHQRYVDELGDSFKGISINYVYNPDYKTKGNMLSLWYARNYCDEDIIFTTSDLLCDRRDIDLFMKNDTNNKILVDHSNKELFSIDDPVKVKIQDGRVVKIRKKLKEIDRVDGISIGIYKFSKKLMTELIDTIRVNIENSKDDLSLYYPIDEILNKEPVIPIYTKKSCWFDIDTPQELVIANKYLNKGLLKT